MAVSADQEHSMLHRKPRILVVGSFVMDVIATTEQIPGAGQTVYGKSFHMAPGGKGANQALPMRPSGRGSDHGRLRG